MFNNKSTKYLTTLEGSLGTYKLKNYITLVRLDRTSSSSWSSVTYQVGNRLVQLTQFWTSIIHSIKNSSQLDWILIELTIFTIIIFVGFYTKIRNIHFPNILLFVVLFLIKLLNLSTIKVYVCFIVCPLVFKIPKK
jgi:hypothetical protein